MKGFDEILENITEIVETYQKGQYRGLNEMHRELACDMYYLTKYQVEFNQKWNDAYHNFNELVGKTSAAAKERHADKEVPQLYMCRKILEAAKGISISIGYEIKSD